MQTLRRYWWLVGLGIAAIVVIVLAPLASSDPDGLESVAGIAGLPRERPRRPLQHHPGLHGARASTIRSSRRSPPGSSGSWSSSPSCGCSAGRSRSERPERRALELDRYIARDSVLPRGDARLKFILTVTFIVMVSLLPVGAYAALILAWLSIVALSWSRGSVRSARRGRRSSRCRSCSPPCRSIFTRPGDPLATFDLGPLTLTISGRGSSAFTTIA